MRFRIINVVVLATFGAALFGATPAAAINCAKASNSVEKRICANSSVKTADAAMVLAYTALLKRAPDAEIRTMLVKSQRRWIEARNKSLDNDFAGKPLPISEVRDAIVARTKQLNDTSDYGMISVALEQRRYFGQFPAAEFSGFDTSCDFVPSERDGTANTYQCFGSVHVQNRDRICSMSHDWATFALYDDYGFSRVADGVASLQAYCDGQSKNGCDAGSPDWQAGDSARSATKFPKPGKGLDKIDAEGVSPIDADYSDWFKACTAKADFPR